MKKVEEMLRERLELADPGLIGCRRRNAWQSDDVPWRHVRGNALLACIGERHTTQTGVGDLDCFLLSDRWLLQFRGGQWNTYWLEDFFDLWSLVHAGGLRDISRSIIVLHENHGELDVKRVDVPEHLDSDARARTILQEYNADPPGRIPKSGPRAQRVCRYCPVKQRCDITDKKRGEDTDWSPNYPIP